MKKYIIIFIFAILVFGNAPARAADQNFEYVVQPLDVLTINVHGQPDLATKTRVSADGNITFPLVGKIEAKGLTVRELELRIKELLEKDYLVTAQVLVFIEDYHPRQVSVMGEVNSPGKYDMPGEKDLTVMQAIAMGGGFTQHAEASKVRVMRKVDGKETTIRINSKDITDRGQKDKDIVLQQDDIVFVPESFF